MEQALQLLIAERDRLNRAIEALQGDDEAPEAAPAPAPRAQSKSSGSKPGPKKRGRRSMSPEARKAVSERMRKYWAARRKAKAKGKG